MWVELVSDVSLPQSHFPQKGCKALFCEARRAQKRCVVIFGARNRPRRGETARKAPTALSSWRPPKRNNGSRQNHDYYSEVEKVWELSERTNQQKVLAGALCDIIQNCTFSLARTASNDTTRDPFTSGRHVNNCHQLQTTHFLAIADLSLFFPSSSILFGRVSEITWIAVIKSIPIISASLTSLWRPQGCDGGDGAPGASRTRRKQRPDEKAGRDGSRHQ